VLRADPDEREELLSIGRPFFASRAGRDRIGVLLTDDTDWQEIRELVTDSYRILAPKKLTALRVGPVATVRDGRRRAASADRSRHGEHPGAGVSVAETLIGRACQQPRFAVSDVRCSRRMTRVTGWPGSGRRLAVLRLRPGQVPGCSRLAGSRRVCAQLPDIHVL
jgi:hypothetical protein